MINYQPVRTLKLVSWLIFFGLSLCLASPGVALLSGDYRLGPEDVLSVTVLRHPELSVDQVSVTADGKIQLPVAGSILVAGRSVSEAQALIADALKSRLVSPEVTVAVKQSRPDRVFVIGSISKPGVYDLQAGWRVTEALASSGGFTNRPEMIAGSLFRLNGESKPLDLIALLGDGNSPANLPLLAGDVLSFTEKTIRVSIAGQVQRPGMYDVPVGASVVEALALAGGAAPRAALSKVEVKRRNGDVLPADMFRVMILGDMGTMPPLEAGDLVMVPESKARVAVLGAVNRPGQYDIEEGATPKVSDAIALAGGSVKRARINQIAVMRAENGETKRIVVDLDHVLHQGKVAEDIPILSGDIVYVPDAKTDWDRINGSLTSLGILRFLIP
jgi:polysaccharide export outer membrane protein